MRSSLPRVNRNKKKVIKTWDAISADFHVRFYKKLKTIYNFMQAFCSWYNC